MLSSVNTKVVEKITNVVPEREWAFLKVTKNQVINNYSQVTTLTFMLKDYISK